MGSDDLHKKRKRKREERKREFINPRAESYLIVSEGEKTEPAYFDALKRDIEQSCGGAIDVKVFGEGRGTTSLVRYAQNCVGRSSRVYQHVWVVFDKDDFTDFDDAIRLARENGFHVAWSNQAFEFWLYLHFYYCDSALHRDDWCEKLDVLFKERGIREEGYEKNLSDLYTLVSAYGDVDMAIRSAAKIRARYGEVSSPSACDPCTTVDLLVSELRSYI